MTLSTFVVVLPGAAIALCAIMAGAWIIQRRTGNSGWVDASWSLGVGAVGCVAALAPLGDDPWPHWRQALIAVLAAAWSLRLGLHIVARTRRHADDPRYRRLMEEWGENAPLRMFWFLQSQAAVGSVLVLAIAAAAHNPDPSFRLQDVLGIAVLIVAIAGEALADAQLRRFKERAQGSGAVCDVGLWRWSRHPNYFFEWLAWIAYPLMAIAPGYAAGWLALAAPLCMYWVLVHVSGVPPLEAHMLRTRGDAYRAYQQRTRAFFPFPRL